MRVLFAVCLIFTLAACASTMPKTPEQLQKEQMRREQLERDTKGGSMLFN